MIDVTTKYHFCRGEEWALLDHVFYDVGDQRGGGGSARGMINKTNEHQGNVAGVGGGDSLTLRVSTPSVAPPEAGWGAGGSGSKALISHFACLF